MPAVVATSTCTGSINEKKDGTADCNTEGTPPGSRIMSESEEKEDGKSDSGRESQSEADPTSPAHGKEEGSEASAEKEVLEGDRNSLTMLDETGVENVSEKSDSSNIVLPKFAGAATNRTDSPAAASGTTDSSDSVGSTISYKHGYPGAAASPSGYPGSAPLSHRLALLLTGTGLVLYPRNVGGGSGSLGSEFLSTTNLYIRGLTPNTTDLDLVNLCNKYGKITSTKAIIDPATGKCKGYGFVDFEVSQSADMAVKGLVSLGVQAQMAKQQEQDPTNLYLANLPEYVDDGYLEHMFLTFGNVVSTRVLRNKDGSSKGVGFCRMESRDLCVKIIDQYNKKQLPGSKEFLLVKFADGGNKKKSQYKNQNAGMPISFDHQNGMGMPMNHGGLMSPRYMPGQQGAYGMHNNWNMYAAGNMPIQGMVPTSVHPGSADPNGMLPSLMAQVNQLHLNSGMSGGYPQQYAANLQMPFGAQSGMMQVQGGYDSSNSPPQLGQMEEAQQHYQAYGGAQGK